MGDAFATAAWVEYHIGRYREAERLADEGFRRSGPLSTVEALYCLDWRSVARCRLGEWDAFFQDQALASALLGDRREQPPGYAADHVAAAAFLHEVRGDQGEANRLVQVVAWLDRAEQRPSVAWSVWRSLVLARRGHNIAPVSDWFAQVGQAQGVAILKDGVLRGGADPRGDGAAVGY